MIQSFRNNHTLNLNWFVNKQPRYNKGILDMNSIELDDYSLNFKNKEIKQSVKNFQLVRPENGIISHKY